MYAVKPNFMFVAKSMMKGYPFKVLTIALLGSIFLFAHALRLCERPINRLDPNMDFGKFKNAIWNVLVTMTTVGYGDFYARTDFGRIVAFLVCIWGVFVVSLMVVTLTNVLNMGALELKAYSVIERLEMKHTMRTAAREVVDQALRMTVRSRRGQRIPKEMVGDLRKKINEFKSVNRHYKSMLDEATNISEDMARQFDFLHDEIRSSVEQQTAIAGSTDKISERMDKMSRVIEDEANMKKNAPPPPPSAPVEPVPMAASTPNIKSAQSNGSKNKK
eukprot:TRINITY_DN2158_c0_g1_i3.p1 TRINITY_DN2158_c0_g1~~TRINITY_DN2158_c0_g1_i3.p1  ORF type:complete len:275 (+),score=81.80 TRINITY_DN2158_c0_g1_i3:816-1640(+)